MDAGRLRRTRRTTAALVAVTTTIWLAACGPGAEDPAPGGAGTSSDEAGSEQPARDTAPASDGGGADSASRAADSSDGGGADPRPSPAGLPEAWAGTAVTDPLDRSDPDRYLLMQYPAQEDRGLREMSAEDLLETEILGGGQGSCQGVASLDGAPATCTVTRGEVSGTAPGGALPAAAYLVPTSYDRSGVLLSVAPAGSPEIPLPPGTPLGLSFTTVPTPEQVTEEMLEETALQAVMFAEVTDGPVPEGIEVDCRLTDGGTHGGCDITGTPRGGGDGTWYATVQPGPDAGWTWYLFAKLPD